MLSQIDLVRSFEEAPDGQQSHILVKAVVTLSFIIIRIRQIFTMHREAINESLLRTKVFDHFQ